jgi:putative transposase
MPEGTIERRMRSPRKTRGATMPQSLVQIYVHVVFSTKDRQPILTDPDFRSRVYAYMVGICKNQDSPSLLIGGVADHVHLLLRLSKTHDLSGLIRDLKRDTTNWIKLERPTLHDFHWQQGYGAFSISPVHVDPLKIYIANQEEHHKKESFKDEFRRVCKLYDVPIDERYVWD